MSDFTRTPLPLPGGHNKVLLHSCCAPCSGEVMEAMRASGIDFTIFFYNPNIHPQKEYDLRKSENIRFAKQFGVHEVHYSIIAILAMGVGLFTPPFGIGFYITCAIGGADPDKAFPHIWIYLAVLLAGVILVAALPWLSVGFL